MPKVTITITDLPKKSVHFAVKFTPLVKPGAKRTNAQEIGAQIYEAIKATGEYVRVRGKGKRT